MVSKSKSKKQIRVTLKKSTCKILPKHKECIKGLGLKRINHSVVLQDDACIRGMVNKVSYLLAVEEV